MKVYVLLALPAAAAAIVGTVSFAAPSAAGPADTPAQASGLGAELFAIHCSSCHGVDGQGVEGRGPTLEDEGAAAANFVLRTGRMPMADPRMQANRGPVRFSEEEIVALTDHVGSFGDGPEVPDVDAERGDVASGGELFRLNCAACHVASGAGAAIGGGRRAPSLMSSTATEVGEAVIVGPGAMPVFASFTDADRDDLAAYALRLQEQNRDAGFRNFGGAGPVAEGLAAWLLALVPLIALTRWIGSPHQGRDTGANPERVDDDP